MPGSSAEVQPTNGNADASALEHDRGQRLGKGHASADRFDARFAHHRHRPQECAIARVKAVVVGERKHVEAAAALQPDRLGVAGDEQVVTLDAVVEVRLDRVGIAHLLGIGPLAVAEGKVHRLEHRGGRVEQSFVVASDHHVADADEGGGIHGRRVGPKHPFSGICQRTVLPIERGGFSSPTIGCALHR